MFPNVLGFDCAFTTIMKITPRGFCSACTITVLPSRRFDHFLQILFGHDSAMLVKKTLKTKQGPLLYKLKKVSVCCEFKILIGLGMLTVVVFIV